ncbi:MAG TPA: sulfatase [Planctomycetes bacterium]|nr:sulfatase [Planctomycetota bacterium]
MRSALEIVPGSVRTWGRLPACGPQPKKCSPEAHICRHKTRRWAGRPFLGPAGQLLSVCGALVLLAFASPGGTTVAAELPNVLLIIGDDQGWGDFGFMGHPVIQTPALDRLASESLVFTRGYVPSSLCRPSLATIVTGLYPHQHGITSNDPPLGLRREEFLRQRREQIACIERVATLPRLLAPRGYVSFQTGKWWEGSYRRGGFTDGMTHGDPRRGGRHGDEGLRIGREGLEPIYRFISGRGDRPFFIWYAPFLPHRPHNPPEQLLEYYRTRTDSIHVARYWAMCQWFDQTCGQLLDYLDRKGLADNTLVVFIVDNGWIQSPAKSGYAPRSKRSPNEGGIRTPIMLRWPGKIRPRRDDEHLAISIDLAPTILTACGLKPTAQMQGINLMDPEAVGRRTTIFGEIFEHNAVDIHRPASSLQFRWCIDGWWKLIQPDPTNAPEAEVALYDLKDDPHENHNLTAQHKDRVTQMQAMLDRWWPAR